MVENEESSDIDSTVWPVQVLADDECSDTDAHNMDHSGILHKASFLLKLKEERRVSQRAIDGIVSDINTLFEKEMATLKAEVTSCFESSHNTVITLEKIKDVFDQKSSVPFFHNLDTEHLQKAYFTKHFNFVVSYV